MVQENENKKEKETPPTLLTLPQELLAKIIALALPSSLRFLALQHKLTECGIGFFIETHRSWCVSFHIRRANSKVKKAADEGMKKIDTLEITAYGCSSKKSVWKGDNVPLGCMTATQWESSLMETDINTISITNEHMHLEQPNDAGGYFVLKHTNNRWTVEYAELIAKKHASAHVLEEHDMREWAMHWLM